MNGWSRTWTLGGDELLIESRSGLLDALVALADHRDAVIVVGAQAIYLHTGAADVALAEATKDSDLAVDARSLGSDPLIEDAMMQAGFMHSRVSPQPGSWISTKGIPVDLMVPEALAPPGGTRRARISPHDKDALRRTLGLEAAVVDHTPMEIRSLSTTDPLVVIANVAGPAALLVAKLHKLGEGRKTPNRLVDKHAHDIYRLLVAITTQELAAVLNRLSDDALAGQVTETALAFLADLFAAGATATGSQMAGRAEQGLGDPDFVSASVAALASDLLAAVETLANQEMGMGE